jgi:CRP-like cAMP-binding protein
LAITAESVQTSNVRSAMEFAMRARHRRDDLASIPLFRDVPSRQRRALTQGAVRLDVAAGYTLFDEDSEGHEFVAVLEGQVEVRRDGELVALLGAGEYLGEAALLTHEGRNASATARTRATIVCIGQSDFAAVIERWPSIAEAIRVTAGERREGA